MATSVSLGRSFVERKSRRGDAAPSIQKDLVGLLIGRGIVEIDVLVEYLRSAELA